ncbi:MAG: hypothetical protein JO202_00385 [Ktedonobacteraceae bacterium]|nr:hypothetical protein [Ktedonobacteraceae bacterium]
MREQVGYPYEPIKRRATAPPEVEVEEDDRIYDTRLPTSVRRYTIPQGEQVIERGNQRIIIHQGKPKRHIPWLTFVGIGMIVAILLVFAFNALSQWWSNHQLDATYGFPRTYQTDAVVYQGDSADHPSHYIFLNLNGTVQIIELPHGDSAHARIYKGPTLVMDNADLVPVTGEFKMINGKEEMIVHIGDQEIIYVSDGTQFKPQQ